MTRNPKKKLTVSQKKTKIFKQKNDNQRKNVDEVEEQKENLKSVKSMKTK